MLFSSDVCMTQSPPIPQYTDAWAAAVASGEFALSSQAADCYLSPTLPTQQQQQPPQPMQQPAEPIIGQMNVVNWARDGPQQGGGGGGKELMSVWLRSKLVMDGGGGGGQEEQQHAGGMGAEEEDEFM